jgi:acyl-CoA dehydrogenase
VIALELVILFFILGCFAYCRTKAWIWTLVLAVIFTAVIWLRLMPLALSIPLAAIALTVAMISNLTLFRRYFITARLITKFRKVLPGMSRTEREALEAGEVWWEGDLFRGAPDWKKLHAIKKPVLTEEEHAFLDNQVETLCEMLDDWKVVRNAKLPDEAWQYMCDEGFLGMIIPKKYGGRDFSALMQSTVVTKLATRCLSSAIMAMVPNSLGPAELLLVYGTEEQKQQYLPNLACGKDIPCFALTSTEGASDAGAMPDTGVVCKGLHDGKEVLGIRLNFDKRYITLAPISTLVGLAFKLFDPDHLMGDQDSYGITCALIPADHPGMEIGNRHFPVYLAFPNGPIRGKDVFIPLDWIIGGPKMAGAGWRMLMECLSAGRGISLPALSTAAGKHTYRMTGAYCKVREQFKVPLGKFEGVQEYMARIGGFTYLLESARLFTAGAVDLGAKPALASAISKYHMTEMCRECSDAAFDIHAGRAIQAGPRNYLANMYLAVPVAITVEGANILTRSLMIFGQGAVRCHPYTFDEMQALQDKDKARGLKTFDALLIKHLGYTLRNVTRTVAAGLTNGHCLRVPFKDYTAKYYKQLTRMSTALAFIADMAMLVLGGELKRKEGLSARLGDVLSYLYLASSALKYFRDHDCQADDRAHLEWCLQYALYQMQEAFYGFFENFTAPLLARALRFAVFPYGRVYTLPSDALSSTISEQMMTPGTFRDRLTQHAFVGKTQDDATGRVEMAFEKMLGIEPLLRRVTDAARKGIVPLRGNVDERLQALKKANLFSDEEYAEIAEFEKLRLDALEVDEFAPDYFKEIEA